MQRFPDSGARITKRIKKSIEANRDVPELFRMRRTSLERRLSQKGGLVGVQPAPPLPSVDNIFPPVRAQSPLRIASDPIVLQRLACASSGSEAGGEQQGAAAATTEFARSVSRMIAAAEERAVARTRADFKGLRANLLGLGKPKNATLPDVDVS